MLQLICFIIKYTNNPLPHKFPCVYSGDLSWTVILLTFVGYAKLYNFIKN